MQAGHPYGLDLPRILGIKITLAGLAAFLLLLIGQPLLALVAAGLLFFLPDYWVVSVRDKRQAAMQADAADIIDQLTICVEAGLGFDAALARVATTTEGPLTDELRHTISDIQAGVPRAQALRTLADRAQIVEIRQLVTALLQAQKHGVPMAETLRIQSAEMRLKRKQRTEEKAAKLTVKMIFPIIVCFLPVFMIITVVPALLTIFRALLGAPRTTRGLWGPPVGARRRCGTAPAPLRISAAAGHASGSRPFDTALSDSLELDHGDRRRAGSTVGLSSSFIPVLAPTARPHTTNPIVNSEEAGAACRSTVPAMIPQAVWVAVLVVGVLMGLHR